MENLKVDSGKSPAKGPPLLQAHRDTEQQTDLQTADVFRVDGKKTTLNEMILTCELSGQIRNQENIWKANLYDFARQDTIMPLLGKKET